MIRDPARWAGVGAAGLASPIGRPISWNADGGDTNLDIDLATA
jgi:hypothetical protein